MKSFITLLVVILIPYLTNAQPLLNIDFSGGYPPAGWTIDAQSNNWSATNSVNAGGIAPELRFNWSPQFNGTSHFISPSVNTTGQTTVTFQFKHYLDHYGGPYTIGVATRSNGGAWNIVWSMVNPTASTQAEELVSISNSDVGAANFQICFFFSGNSYNINYWYIDDVKLFVPLAHDAMVKDILTNPEYVAGTPFTPEALLKNFGLNTETFNATCVIKLNGSSIYTQNCTSITLTMGEEQSVSFPDFTPPNANDIYEITVTSNLTGDMDSTNDSRTEGFDTYTTEREMVILEIGTGTWCVYCPGASMGAHDLLANGKAVGVVKYHNGDSFTNSYSDARNTYYGINGFPTAVFDGVEYFIGGSNTQSMYQYYLPLYDARKVKNSAFSVQIFGQNNGLDYSLTIRVSKLANIPTSYSNLVLHLALTESDIPFNWQGQTMINNTERLMAPNELGTALDFSSGNVVDINLNFTMNAAWVTENCELVSFIQNLDGKEILQGTKVALTGLTPVSVELTSLSSVTEYTLGQNYPNPFNPTTTIKYSVPQYGLVSIVVYDITGQKVATLVNEVKDAGNYEIDFKSVNLSSGVYFYRMTANNFTQVKKMSILK